MPGAASRQEGRGFVACFVLVCKCEAVDRFNCAAFGSIVVVACVRLTGVFVVGAGYRVVRGRKG